MKKKRWYGLLGLLSLLGFIGVFTQERAFLGFFAFALDFQYFFVQADEMQEEQIRRSAALGFFWGMGTSVAAMGLLILAGVTVREGLYAGLALGWGVAVAVYALTGFWYSCREWWHART